jgi:hypothetical protein
VALGDRVIGRWCLLLLEVATTKTAWWRVLHRKARKKILRSSEEGFVRGIVLTPREPRRTTLVERDAKGDKWSSHVKC